MTYTAIDGDVSDFIDSMIELADKLRTDELRGFLINAGHSVEAATDAIARWQAERFERSDPSCDCFRLNDAGLAAVKELRAHRV